MKTATKQIPEIEESALVSRILEGESRLFEQIIRKYNQRLYRIGMAILKNDVDTEDAKQSAYIKAYQNLDKFEARAELATWLNRIMINECLAAKKKKQKYIIETDEQLVNNSTMTTPSNILINKELNGLIEDAVAQLPEKYRLVFVLREIEEMSIKETGDTLKIEESNVKVRLNRAKTMLQQHLSGYMKENVYSYHLSRCDMMVQRVFGHLGI